MNDQENTLHLPINNLVIITRSEEEFKKLYALVSSLFNAFAAHVIFIHIGKSIPPPLSNKFLFFGVTEEEVTAIPYIIYSHLTSDLPLYVFLNDYTPIEAKILENLKSYITRIILFSNLKKTNAILEIMHNASSHVTDVNFARTRAWRRALKKVFDPYSYTSELSNCVSIEISYVKNPIEALFLQAYIVTKLSWKLHHVKNNVIYYDNGRLVRLIEAENALLFEGAICSVNFVTAGGYHFYITHENDKHFVKVYISSLEHCEIPYTIYLSNYETGSRLVYEMLYSPLLPSFGDIVRNLAGILRKEQGEGEV